ncbi:lipoxygenase [Metarhizium guizhouense ARSEF 977]|uniref:Manganese lipoxygenase n=1 Tax=Metarhizium guizhouense (strain ARSEF 977) TaxID=1276136 RepID=A0A0B4HPD4_METGA|nr:lipoxygenase [Metarhizium guizhouense ARSEF 977]
MAEPNINQVPSDNACEPPNSVNSVATSQGIVQVDNSNGMPASEYWETVSDFASDITRAAKNALSNRRSHFKKVVAVIAYWETSSGLDHLRAQADELGKLFEDDFKFEVLVYKIPDNVTDRKFISTIGDELDKVSKDRDSLFILYYGGHATMPDTTTTRLWKKENRPRSPEIEWSSAIRSLFKTGAICSKLFVFDCCHAGGMIDPTLAWETSFSSFTTAFLEEISNNTYDVWELHSVLCDSDKRNHYKLSKFPHYQDFMGHQGQSASTLIKKVGPPVTSENRPQTAPDMLDRLTTMTDAVICIAVTFNCTAEAFIKEFDAIQKNWKRWFRFAPTEFDDVIVKACRGSALIAAFNSNSCITIWSFPVWLWDAMAPLSGYQFIGIIRPKNVALIASGAQAGVAGVDVSSNTMSVDERMRELDIEIQDVPFVDVDPGVFNRELLRLGLYAQPNQLRLEQPPVLGGGNITEGTYSGTQAALTHAYNRIERSYESYFDVLQIEPSLPRYIELSAKQEIFQYSQYPKNPDGSVAQYPPHLEHIPKQDQVSLLKIFNALGLAETQVLIKQVVPDSFTGRTARWLLDLVNGNVSDATQQGSSIKAYETYNMLHRKSGTDIEQGANLGLLPDWYTDRRFADQSFTGTNPTTIKKISPSLLDEFIAAAKQSGYDHWAQSLPANADSLFVQDCRYFRAAFGAQADEELHHKEPVSDNSWACAAITLFQLHPDGKLHPVAIVCDYKGTMASSVTVFNQRQLPTDPSGQEESDWTWRYAKTCAQVSDWIRHEVGVHLTRAHMIEESLIVATHRTIPMDHIVFKLLEPHWYRTLSLNAAARSTLVPQIIKDLVGLKPEYLYQLIRYEFESFDYVNNYVPNDLARRGFPNTTEGLSGQKYKNYAYAKNMTSMWYCIRKYVMNMLQTYYGKDGKNVQDDQCITDWCKEVQTKGFIKSFPTIKRLDELCDAVTMSIHIAAPFHSAVNYLQSFYQTFVLAKPPCLCSPLPQTLEELKKYTEKDLVDALPLGRQRQWLLSVQVPWLLSFKTPSDRSLISFAQSQWHTHRGDSQADREIGDISEQFYNELKKLQVEFLITSKSMDKNSIPYMVLDPSNTAASILI